MDPRQWTTVITDQLFQRDSRRLERIKEELIEANHRLGGPVHGFLYNGTFHTTLPVVQQSTAEKKLLLPALHAAGEEFVKDQHKTAREQVRVKQGIFALIQGCKSDQDVRDALPEVVVSTIPELQKMNRLREPGWPFRDNPLQQHVYKETEELLTFYVCNQLLY